MEAILVVMVLAILVEAIVQVVKTWVPEKTKVPGFLWPVTSAVLGVALCILAKVDILTLAGVTLLWPIVGQILTGVIISRGASFVHDLWAKIKGDWNEPEKTTPPSNPDNPA